MPNGQILREVDTQRLPDPGQGPGRGDPHRGTRPGRPAGGRPLAHRPAQPRLRFSAAGPSATTVRYDYLQLNCWTSSTRARQALRSRRRPARVRLRGARRRERRAGRRPEPADPERRDQRPPDDARRDPRAERRRRRNVGMPKAAISPTCCRSRSSAVNAAGQTRLDGDRRQACAAAGTFRFVNTHLEAFDDPTDPSIRARRRPNWSPRAARRPATCRSILVGDLNSDDDTVEPGDRQAYKPCSRRASSSAAPRTRSAAASTRACSAKRRRRQRRRLRPPGRPRDDQRPEGDQAVSLGGDRPAAGQRLLGLRPRRGVQRTGNPAVDNARSSAAAICRGASICG